MNDWDPLSEQTMVHGWTHDDMIKAHHLLTSTAKNSDISALNSVQGLGIATDWNKIVSDASARITSPQQSLFCNAGFYCQSVLKDKEPELQTIKKHRFIKLEKL